MNSFMHLNHLVMYWAVNLLSIAWVNLRKVKNPRSQYNSLPEASVMCELNSTPSSIAESDV